MRVLGFWILGVRVQGSGIWVYGFCVLLSVVCGYRALGLYRGLLWVLYKRLFTDFFLDTQDACSILQLPPSRAHLTGDKCNAHRSPYEFDWCLCDYWIICVFSGAADVARIYRGL